MRIPEFTPAERRVVRLISLGLSTREVAHVLGKAESTVDNQRTSAMRSAEITTATELVRVALLSGVTTLEDALTPSERRKVNALRRQPAVGRRRTKPSSRRKARSPRKTKGATSGRQTRKKRSSQAKSARTGGRKPSKARAVARGKPVRKVGRAGRPAASPRRTKARKATLEPARRRPQPRVRRPLSSAGTPDKKGGDSAPAEPSPPAVT